MSGFRKFKKPEVTIGKPDIVQNILNLVKKDETTKALHLALLSLSIKEMVDFAITIVEERYKIYKLGVSNLKDVVQLHRAGNQVVMKKFIEQLEETHHFKFSAFNSACLNIVKVERDKNIINQKIASDFILLALMSLPQEPEESEYKSIHMKMISGIMSFKFNNNTMKVLYGV